VESTLLSSTPSYAERHCLTNFSFQREASHPEELVSQAFSLGYAALAITDECSVAGVVRAHLEAKKNEANAAGGGRVCIVYSGQQIE
jgi:error-prone DNA polymerase